MSNKTTEPETTPPHSAKSVHFPIDTADFTNTTMVGDTSRPYNSSTKRRPQSTGNLSSTKSFEKLYEAASRENPISSKRPKSMEFRSNSALPQAIPKQVNDNSLSLDKAREKLMQDLEANISQHSPRDSQCLATPPKSLKTPTTPRSPRDVSASYAT